MRRSGDGAVGERRRRRRERRAQAIPSVSEFPRSPGYDQLMAVPYGFKSWQEYVDKHIAECGDCAPYFQGDGQMSIEGKETEVSWLALELGLPDRVSKRLIDKRAL